jgi:hypothetical protein
MNKLKSLDSRVVLAENKSFGIRTHLDLNPVLGTVSFETRQIICLNLNFLLVKVTFLPTKNYVFIRIKWNLNDLSNI